MMTRVLPTLKLYALFLFLSLGGWALGQQKATAQYHTIENNRTLFLPVALHGYAEGDSFYVSKLGSNGNGRSWGTAWNELDQIDWNQIKPGDTIYVDGGTGLMTYMTPLIPAANGTSDRPIAIRLGLESGRNGQAVMFGGNYQPLPECGQLAWDERGLNNAGDSGIVLQNQLKHVVIDGRKRGGFLVQGWKESGVRFVQDSINNGQDDNPQNITLRHIEIYNNGGIERFDDGEVKGLYYPRHSRPGISLAGSGHLFEFLEIHDNAGDAIQSGSTGPERGIFNNLDDITIKNSWLYNSRVHSGTDNSPADEVCNLNDFSGCDELGAPQMSRDYHFYPTVPTDRRESFNWCTHSDGIQIYSSNALNNLTIQGSIIGPNFMNGLILGDNEGENESAWVNNLIMKDVVVTRYMHNALGMNNKGGTSGSNWDIDHVTFYGHFNNIDKGSLHLDLVNSAQGHRVTNSYKIHGQTNFETDQLFLNNNCEYDLYNGSLEGTVANPQFRRISNKDLFVVSSRQNFDEVFTDIYEPANLTCASVGSRIHSLSDVFP